MSSQGSLGSHSWHTISGLQTEPVTQTTTINVPASCIRDSHASGFTTYQPAALLEEKADSDHQALLMLEAEQAPVDHLFLD